MGFLKWLRGEYDTEPEQQPESIPTESAPIEETQKTEESDQPTNYEVFNNRFDYERCYRVTGKTIIEGIIHIAEILLLRNKYFSTEKNNSWCNVSGMEHFKMSNQPWELMYGFVVRDINNPRNSKTLKLVDTSGEILGLVPKNELKWLYQKYNIDSEDFTGLPFIGCTYERKYKVYGKINVIGNFEDTKTELLKDATDIMTEGALELIGNMFYHKLNDPYDY